MLFRSPNEYAQAALQIGRDTLDALDATARALPVALFSQPSVRRWYYDAVATIGDSQRAAAVALGVGVIKIAETGATGGGATSNARPLQATSAALTATVAGYTVQAGDTLQSIASAKLGDASLAGVIANLNGMLDAGTMNDGAPLRAGVKLLLPAPTGAVAPLTKDGAAVQVDPYGVDLLLDRNGDLVFPGDGPLDLAVIQATPNYVQALTSRCRTVQGEHKVFPSYGLPAHVGSAATVTTAGLLASQLRAQLTMDPRTTSVNNIRVLDGVDTTALSADVQGVLGLPQPLLIPMAA